MLIFFPTLTPTIIYSDLVIDLPWVIQKPLEWISLLIKKPSYVWVRG